MPPRAEPAAALAQVWHEPRPERLPEPPLDPALVAALRAGLRAIGSPWAALPLQPLADTGLAHLHLRLQGSPALLRVPKQSQMGLSAAANLAYEAACYARAWPSGHVPQGLGVLPPAPGLPRGALLVEAVAGRPARLPQDLPAIAAALAAVHALPLPSPGQAGPLLYPVDALADLRDEIERQAQYLPAAGLLAATRAAIDAGRARLARLCDAPARPPRGLIAFDAHPGNFLLRRDGRAVLVDLEKARYSHPPLDLAHATLYTSTTWDAASAAELDIDAVAGFYETWAAHVSSAAVAATGATVAARAGMHAQRPWFVPLREAMWLWSLTWCAKWRVLSTQAADGAARGEDWSSERSSDALVAHVRSRVDCYLSADVVAQVRDELATLAQRWR